MANISVHLTHGWTFDLWEGVENQLVKNSVEPGIPLDGPLIFDVPEGSTRLSLTIDGADESIDLGF